jgi:hypothetical protein
MKNFLFFLSLLGIIIQARGQENIVKAKIITQDSTVINAEVRLTSYEGTPQSFSYTVNGIVSKITVENLRSVEFSTGEVFERHFISISTINKDIIDRARMIIK